jgi:hypothetical protein
MHSAHGRLMLETSSALCSYISTYIPAIVLVRAYTFASDSIFALHGLVAHPCCVVTLPSRHFQCT